MMLSCVHTGRDEGDEFSIGTGYTETCRHLLPIHTEAEEKEVKGIEAKVVGVTFSCSSFRNGGRRNHGEAAFPIAHANAVKRVSWRHWHALSWGDCGTLNRDGHLAGGG